MVQVVQQVHQKYQNTLNIDDKDLFKALRKQGY